MTKNSVPVLIALTAIAGSGIGAAFAAAPPTAGLTETEKIAVFKAAGAAQSNGKWVICKDDPNPSGASIESIVDRNGDGLPEVVVVEGGSACYGKAEAGYKVLSKQLDGTWKVVTSNNGIPQFLKTTGANGWPDISVGGPGFCFAVQRWNGKEYAFDRYEYEGKSCKPKPQS